MLDGELIVAVDGRLDFDSLSERVHLKATDGRRVPGAVNRRRCTEPSWVPLRPEWVAEVSYEHTEGGFPSRFRHNALFVRPRPDREPASCRYDQLEGPVSFDLESVLAGEVLPR